MQDFRNLSVWQRARRLTKSVYEMTADFPGSEEFGLNEPDEAGHGLNLLERRGKNILSDDRLDTVIQIKRMLGGLLSRLGWGRIPDPPRGSAPPQAAPRAKADG
jgi:hypothetical protein